jgi:ectoine hydroxylase-related dioxygenase (phytanoyl-CoA dioxygenase family)
MTANLESAPVSLTPVQENAFKQDGFIALQHFLDAPTLTALRDYYDKIISGEIVLPGDRQLGGVTRQVMCPNEKIPFFADNPAVRAGKAIAEKIFGGAPVKLQFDMLIYKPPMHPKATPWHQDYSYSQHPFVPPGTEIPNDSLQFWVPLDDVDPENGCMFFVAGQHRKPLNQHYVIGDSTMDARLLATDAFGPANEPNAGTPCPLPAGGCTIHYYGTPHYTPPNKSQTRGRRAYIFNIQKA